MCYYTEVVISWLPSHTGMTGRYGSMFNAAILLNIDGVSSALDVPARINMVLP